MLDPAAEEATARALVDRRLRATRGLPPATRVRRLAGLLARRGYSAGLAARVVRAALAEEDLDPDGLAILDVDDIDTDETDTDGTGAGTGTGTGTGTDTHTDERHPGDEPG
jgi:cobalamin biosynthesis protein CbiG